MSFYYALGLLFYRDQLIALGNAFWIYVACLKLFHPRLSGRNSVVAPLMRLFASEKTRNLKTLNCFQTIFGQYMEDYLLFWEVYLHSHTWFRQIFVPHWISPVPQTLFLLSSLLNKFLIDNLLRTLIHF